MAKYAIGIDFGTLSCRAVLVDIHTGEVAAQSVYQYPHGILSEALPTGEALPPQWALQDPEDYVSGLVETVSGLMHESRAGAESVVGLGIDATASTLLPVTREMVPLCHTEAFCREPHAYMKLWKHHGGEAAAARMTETARERNEPWLACYGGKISSEWMFPKILETLESAPAVYDAADYFLEVMDWLTWMMTGQLSVSACGMGYKALYAQGQFPDSSYFEALHPRMGGIVSEKMNLPILPIGGRAGVLMPEMAERLHLLPGTPVGTPIIDAHSALLGGGITKPGEMMIIMGTSACHLMLSERDVRIPGIQGIVRDGILPGLYGIEAGQSCLGDHFAWALSTCFPEQYAVEAREKGISGHDLMTEKIRGYRAGENGLLALDWFNGVRTPLMDFDLNGLILGLSLSTKPEDIYLALIEATAFGTRVILDGFETAGVEVKQIVLAGGIPAKNPFIVQLYADVLGRPVRVCASDQASAFGAAAIGISAASPAVTGYGSLEQIVRTLGRTGDTLTMPDAEQSARYELLYADYLEMHRLFGRGGSEIMHRLTRRRGLYRG